MMRSAHEVLIVGAGPTGLLLAVALAQRGLRVHVLEQRTQAATASRSIGVHPPSLARLASLRLDGELIARGCRIRRGVAYAGARALATVSFERLPGAHPFVLSVPQAVTERILEDALRRRGDDLITRGVEVERLLEEDGAVTVRGRREGGAPYEARAEWVVGCDGKHSRVRRAAGIDFPGGPYRGRFAMADFHDARSPDEAGVYFDPEGFTESFPLPGGQRRWVVACRRMNPPASVDLFRSLVARRTGHRLSEPATPLSEFAAERYAASRCRRGRLLLAGDAAHVISPVGGQGMNIGWMDALELADALAAVALRGEPADGRLAAYERRVLARANEAARRAEQYMAAGFARWPGLRDALLGWALRSPLHDRLARRFALCDLHAA